MIRKRAKRKPPKRRSPVAAALRSPALRKRVVPNKKRKKLLPSWGPETIRRLFAVERF